MSAASTPKAIPAIKPPMYIKTAMIESALAIGLVGFNAEL